MWAGHGNYGRAIGQPIVHVLLVFVVSLFEYNPEEITTLNSGPVFAVPYTILYYCLNGMEMEADTHALRWIAPRGT